MKKTVIVSTAVVGVLLVFFIFLLIKDRGLKQEITITPHNVNANRASVLSSSASLVLRYIEEARQDISEKNLNQAKIELKKATRLLRIIDESRPYVMIKNHIWLAKEHLSFEDTSKVEADMIPIYSALDEIDEFVPVEKVKQHVNEAESNLNKGDIPTANEKLEEAEAALIYSEVDLPLDLTTQQTRLALSMLADNNPDKADSALVKVENALQVVSVGYFSPYANAKYNYWKAKEAWAKGEFKEAEKDIKNAQSELSAIIQTGDKKVKHKVDELHKDILSLEQKIVKKNQERG